MMKTGFLLAGCLVAAQVVALELGAPFTDGLVLQRERPVRVWGTAQPGERVKVEFAGAAVAATADAQGDWRVELPPMPASAVGRELRVTGAEEQRTVGDVLVGEVWIAAGQSNMDQPLWNQWNNYRDNAGVLLSQYLRRDRIRFIELFDEKWSVEPRRTTAARWRRVTPEVLGDLSAVGYYFAEELHQALEIPIGLVVAAWGGTNIDAWTPREGYRLHPELEQEANYRVTEDWNSSNATRVISWGGQQPTVIYNQQLAPMAPMTVRGVIWYQGEHNVGEAERGNYAVKLRALLDGWRATFENPELKFYLAQIAPFNYQGAFSSVERAAQLMLEQEKFVRTEPAAGLVTTADVDSFADVHPADKLAVGRRLAMLALKRDYGFEGICADPPLLVSAQAVTNTVELVFSPVKSWYLRRGDLSLDLSFEVRDAAGAWHAAQLVNLRGVVDGCPPGHGYYGQVEGDKLVLSSPAVAEPCGARYLFVAPCRAGLTSNYGHPLGPFSWEKKKAD